MLAVCAWERGGIVLMLDECGRELMLAVCDWERVDVGCVHPRRITIPIRAQPVM